MENTGFFEKVYEVARQIPYGRVTSYGAIANFLGMPKSARMVGWALNASKNDDSVPAHRVVNQNGLLTGKNHFEGTNLMAQLLESEDIIIRDYEVVNFKNIYWNPLNELTKQ